MAATKSKADTELKIALDNRAFEIQLFWQRSNYFLVLMTALGVATFSVRDLLFSPLVSMFATAASYFWFRTNAGSKFWQESWEVEVVSLAKEQGIRSFERPTDEVIDQVKRSLAGDGQRDSRSLLRRWVDTRIMQKYSVTYNMILLSMFATLVWGVVTTVFLTRLIDHYCDLEGWCPVCAR
jgi:hypothetical protein